MRSGALLCVRCTAPSSTFAQRRFASSSPAGTRGAQSHFRAGNVDPTPYQVKPNFTIPMWQPPARFMKYKAVRWLSNNLLALATYQLALEVGFTIAFGSLLYADAITGEGVCTGLTRYHYPFVSWIDLGDCVYTEPLNIGPFSLNPQKMTALHMGHNIANGLLPVQVLLMISTFAPARYGYRRVRGLPAPVDAFAVAAAEAAREAAAKAAGGAPRRASYARASPTRVTPPQSFR